MDSEPVVKRGRGRPRKNPPPTVVAKSTIVRISSVDGSRTEYKDVVQSSLNYAGNKYPGPGGSDLDAFRLKDLDSPGRAPVLINPEEAPKAETPANVDAPVKRKRGRPRKNPLPAVAEKAAAAEPTAEAPVVKRRPGRPRKNPLPADNCTTASAPIPQTPETEGVRVKRKYTRRIQTAGNVYNSANDSTSFNSAVSEGENPFTFKGPGVRRGKEIQVGEAKLSFFYIVFKNPNNDGLLYPDTMHSIQHMLSAAAKETNLKNVVKVLPCGSRTAFEVAVLDPQSDFANNALRKLMINAAYMEKLPESELRRCSNPLYHNFEDAHREICDFVNTLYGVVINSQTGDYSW